MADELILAQGCRVAMPTDNQATRPRDAPCAFGVAGHHAVYQA